MGCDGTTFVFISWPYTAKCWSPTKDSNCKRLVALADSICKAVELNDSMLIKRNLNKISELHQTFKALYIEKPSEEYPYLLDYTMQQKTKKVLVDAIAGRYSIMRSSICNCLFLYDSKFHFMVGKSQERNRGILLAFESDPLNVRLQFRKFVDLPNMNDEGTFDLHIPTVFINARDLSPDSLDVNVKSVLINKYYESVKREIHILSHDEILTTRKILESYFENKEYEKSLDKDRYPYPFNQYVRQYTAYAENDDIIVEVNLITSWPSLDGYTSLKKDVHVVYDGGPSFASAKVNLTKGVVIWFRTNGEA